MAKNAVKVVNSWVNNATHGLITEVATPGTLWPNYHVTVKELKYILYRYFFGRDNDDHVECIVF